MISGTHLQPVQGGSPNTIGEWQTETESVGALDKILNDHSNLWHIKAEVRGRLIQPGQSQEDRSLRIDRVLIPKQDLLAINWKHGAFGIECKKSGERIGPPIAQATDYNRAIYTLDSGLKIWLEYVFVWPMDTQHGPLASVLYHQRVGSASWDYSHKLILRLGEQNLLRIRQDGNISINLSVESDLRKTGSR